MDGKNLPRVKPEDLRAIDLERIILPNFFNFIWQKLREEQPDVLKELLAIANINNDVETTEIGLNAVAYLYYALCVAHDRNTTREGGDVESEQPLGEPTDGQ